MFIKWLVVLFVIGAAGTAFGDNKKQESEALVLRALELSNIRAEGATSFTVTAKFQVANGSSGISGTYSEIWMSKDKWIREVTMGNSRRLEIANGRKKWLLDQDLNPRYFTTLTSALTMAGPAKGTKAKNARSTEVDGISARCVGFDGLYAKEIYCIDPKDGTLMTRRRIENLGSKSPVTISYGNYEKLGEHLFPREMQYRDDAQDSLDIRVSKLSFEVAVDASDFIPPAGSLEMANCDENQMKAPSAIFELEPQFPAGTGADRAITTLSLVVGADGKPGLIHVTRSGGTAFDVQAVRAVREWKFRPATCQGLKTAATIAIEIEFHR